jgi:hypothetical protein
MKKLLLVVLALAAVLVIAPAAKADNFTFTFTGGGSGTLTGTALPGGGFGITGGSFTFNGQTFNLVQDTVPGFGEQTDQNIPGSGGLNLTYDDRANSSGLPADGDGLLFVDSNGLVINIWNNGNGTFQLFESNGDNWTIDMEGNEVLTPEPSSLLLLGTGILLLAGLLYLKPKPRTVSAPIAVAA